MSDNHRVVVPSGDFSAKLLAVPHLEVLLGSHKDICGGVKPQKLAHPLLRIVINSIATLDGILENKEIGLLASLYGGLPEGTIAEKIYKLRKINGLGLEGFAERIGKSISAVRAWEIGDAPSRASLDKICLAFGLDVSYFEGSD